MEQLDLTILYFLNHTIASEMLDTVMTFLTSFRSWLPIYAIAITYLISKHKWYGVRVVIGVAVLAGLANTVTNLFLKELLERPRPCAVDAAGLPLIDWLRLPDGARGGYSLPSSHAVNNFAAAAFFGMLFPSRRTMVVLFFVAFVIALTRPYLGLHYPSDTLAGIVIGCLIGYYLARVFMLTEERYFAKPKSNE